VLVKGAAKKRKTGSDPAAVVAVSQLELLAGSFIKMEAVDSRHFREHFWNEVDKKLTKGFSNYDDVGHLLRITYSTPTPLRRFENVFDGFCTSKEEVKSASQVERDGVIVHLTESTIVARTAPTMYEILALVPEGRAIVPSSVSKHRFVVLGAVGILAKLEFNRANFPQEFAALGDKPPLQCVFVFP
jgi:hypothetical protein